MIHALRRRHLTLMLKQASLMLVCLLSACASAPPPRWLSLPLPPDLAAPAVAPLHANLPVLVVRRIGLPEYLQTNKVRYRLSGSVLGEWPGLLWAERLETGMTDHMIMRLRTALPGWTVCDRLCPPGMPKATLGLDLVPLDYLRDVGQLHANAHWDIALRNTGGGTANSTLSGAQAYALPVQADGGEGQAAAIGQLLDLLSEDIAKGLRASDTH